MRHSFGSSRAAYVSICFARSMSCTGGWRRRSEQLSCSTRLATLTKTRTAGFCADALAPGRTLRVTPLASCVDSRTLTRLYTLNHSGW